MATLASMHLFDRPRRDRTTRLRWTKWARHSLLSVGLVIAVTVLGAPTVAQIAPTNMTMFYLVAVVISAAYLGRGPAVLAAILGVLALDFFFVPPHFTFAVADTQYLLTFGGLLIVGLVISELTARVREQADAAQARELQATELYEFTRDLAAALGLDDIVRATATHVSHTFGSSSVVWLSEGPRLVQRGGSETLAIGNQDLAAAQWAFAQGQAAGQTTDTFASAAIRAIPLKTAQRVVGVLGIAPVNPSILFPREQQRLLESFATQAALAIERAQLAEQARQAQVLQTTEKLQSALLNSISHDLRTPLVSITGTLSTLQEEANDAEHQSMIDTAYSEARRLNHLVGNLLDMSRIEAGAMRVRHVPCDAQDVIGSALEQLGDRIKGRTVTVDLPSTLPLVPMDFVLIVQVLVNLIENATKYSPANKPIEVQARISDGALEIRVLDRGAGIPTTDLQHIFDKFYRVRRPDGVVGTGLGLSICKGIVEAHHGHIQAANREGGGTVMTVTLPLQPGVQV